MSHLIKKTAQSYLNYQKENNGYNKKSPQICFDATNFQHFFYVFFSEFFIIFFEIYKTQFKKKFLACIRLKLFSKILNIILY